MIQLPKVTKNLFIDNQEDWEYIDVVLNAFQPILEANEDAIQTFSNKQLLPLIYSALFAEVADGGFLQLILNGYADSVLNKDFMESLNEAGMTETARLIDEVKIIFDQNQSLLTGEKNVEEIDGIYAEFKMFIPLEDRFYEIMDREVQVLRKYIEQNRAQFVEVIS